MAAIESQVLVKKDNLDKLRIVSFKLFEHDHIPDVYNIRRVTGLLGGAMIEQPSLEITEGKANRTAEQQARLEYNSILSDYLDKGYKQLEKYGINSITELTPSKVKEILQDNPTDAKGIIKPMLAKTAFDKGDKRWNMSWYASVKIDGVRCLMFWNDKNKRVETSSRGGKDYNKAIKHILTHPNVVSFFRDNPNIILDGEIYIHGKPLNYINGLASSRVNTSVEQQNLWYYVFDVVENNTFNIRLETINWIADMKDSWLCPFGDAQVTLVRHTLIHGYEEIMRLHNDALQQGYEGLVLRDPWKKYGYGSRDWRMIKVKVFDDAEFQIVGAEAGLRDEDMVFVMQMTDGKTFEAKPAATREDRIYYINNIDSLIGKFGTVKYFGFGANGLPNLPIFKAIQD